MSKFCNDEPIEKVAAVFPFVDRRVEGYGMRPRFQILPKGPPVTHALITSITFQRKPKQKCLHEKRSANAFHVWIRFFLPQGQVFLGAGASATMVAV